MITKLAKYCLAICMLLLTVVSTAKAQQAIAWQTDIESALSQAARSNRLVLVHFGATWCRPCMKLEREVFSKPAVGEALEKNYVLVKLDADQHKAVAQKYQVKSLPTDIILAPNGQKVASFNSPGTPASYVGRMDQLASQAIPQYAAQVASIANPYSNAAQRSTQFNSGANGAYPQQTADPRYSAANNYATTPSQHNPYNVAANNPYYGTAPAATASGANPYAGTAAGPTATNPPQTQPYIRETVSRYDTGSRYDSNPQQSATQPNVPQNRYNDPGYQADTRYANNPAASGYGQYGSTSPASQTEPPAATAQTPDYPRYGAAGHYGGSVGNPASEQTTTAPSQTNPIQPQTIHNPYTTSENRYRSGGAAEQPNSLEHSGNYGASAPPHVTNQTAPPVTNYHGETTQDYRAQAPATAPVPYPVGSGDVPPPQNANIPEANYAGTPQVDTPARYGQADTRYATGSDPALQGTQVDSSAGYGQADTRYAAGSGSSPPDNAGSYSANTPNNAPAAQDRYAAQNHTVAPFPSGQAPHAEPPVAQGSPATGQPNSTGEFGLEAYCPVTLRKQQKWVKGDKRWGAIHRGKTYLFAGLEQQQMFLARPDYYSPVLSGIDPVIAIDNQQITEGKRKFGVYRGEQIYLFSSQASLDQFLKAPHRYIEGVEQAMRQADSQMRR